jgi:hypothetical protein
LTVVKVKKAKPEVEIKAMTCAEAVKAYPGTEEIFLARMCLKGQSLARKHGGASKVPEKEKKTALFAKKVNNRWFIPVPELDRVFLVQ